MITIDKNTIAIWYLAVVPGEQDFMGGLFRDENNKIKFEYRFRYYNSNDAFDEKDTKNWYSVTPKEDATEEVLLDNIRQIINKLELASGEKADEIVMKDGDTDKFLEEMASKRWAHMKPETRYEGQNRKNWN